MISKLWCYFIISITLISIPAYPILPQLDSSTLVTANLFFRHGARTPLVDPHPRAQIQKVKWSDGPGILTKVGKEKMFDLGKTLKVYFQEFLFPLHSYDEIKLSTTGIQRTEQSAIALVAGLFGPVEQEKWKDGLEIPPIVFNVDETIDKSTIINSPNACPLFKVEQKVTIEKARVGDRGFEDVYRFLTPYAGVQVNGMFDIFPLWDNLECMHHNNLELPNWTSYVYPSRMSQIMAKVLRSMIVGSDTMVRLAAGPYIQEVQNQFRMAAAGVPSVKKLIIHGGHDFSMTANLGALGNFEKIVNPGDALLLELHYVKKYGYFVQAVYIEAGGSNISVLKIKNCGQLCPLDQFMELTKNSIPRNWNSECIAYRPRL